MIDVYKKKKMQKKMPKKMQKTMQEKVPKKARKKRWSSPFSEWLSSVFRALSEEKMGGVGLGGVLKLAGYMWKQMSEAEKKPWQEAHRCLRGIRELEKKQKRKNGQGTPPVAS